MQTGYYASAAGMVTQFNRIDTIANNLANANTIGFKQDNLIVGDFMRLYKEARDTLPNENNTKEAAAFINRTMSRAPQVVDAYTDQSLGTMQKSTNNLDFALSQEGLFFAVKTPQGIRLTRDGSFTTNEEGVLVTKEGHEVLADDYFKSGGNISFATQDSVVEVDKNGQLYTNVPNSATLTPNKKLFIANPQNLKFLQKEGANLYKTDEINYLEPLADSGAVLQGFVEKSNVNPVAMMTSLIETNRLVGMYQKAMDTQMNDMNREAIDKIAKRA